MSAMMKLMFAGCGGAIMLAAAPAMAGTRCGGALAVDAATTLTEVARRCNVNLSALYEANPGVDPRNVVPGTYLAIPDELEAYALSGAPQNISTAPDASSSNSQATNNHDLSGDYPDAATRVYDGRISTRARLRHVRLASDDPVWAREETGGGNRSYAADRMSYQKRSASRIHNAGVQTFTAPSNPSLRNTISATRKSSGASSSQLISCATVKGEGRDIRKVQKIISTPTNTFVEVVPNEAGGLDCTLINAAGAADIAPTPGVPAAHFGLVTKGPALPSGGYRLPDYNAINPKDAAEPQQISLRGDIVAQADGCLVLDAGAGGRWALASAPDADSLVGKHITAWGVASQSGACGASPTLIVSHAVYAEPWSGR